MSADEYIYININYLTTGELGDPAPPRVMDRYRGDLGDDGFRGLPGRTGNPGMAGDPGREGEDGFPGLPGRKGVEGDDGLPGFPGQRGFRGSKGYPGISGDPGLPGLDGVPGRPGLNAFKGKKVRNVSVTVELPSLISTTSIRFIPSKFDHWYRMYGGC